MYPQRRDFLKAIAGSGMLALAPRCVEAQEQVARATRGTPQPRIKDISVIECQPAGVRLTVVKITTDQDGLYGYGCATFTQRADLVKPAVEKYLKPFLLNKTTDRIEDIWQSCYDSSYWKNGPVLNNAHQRRRSGALGHQGPPGRNARLPARRRQMPRSRRLPTHTPAALSLRTWSRARSSISRKVFAMCAFRWDFPEWRAMARAQGDDSAEGAPRSSRCSSLPTPCGAHLKLLEFCRRELGEEVELLHDMHERLTPNEAVQFCKEAEQYRMFFLEDPLSPEDLVYFRQIRQNCATPIAMGELFNNPHEWQPLIEGRLIDYIRVHLSQVGGFSPARKIAILAEQFGVKTAWHGPGDVSPVGHMANVTLDLVSYNFGIQEYSPFNERTQAIFQGCPEMKDGYLWVSEKPGWGIEIDEKEAAKAPFTGQPVEWRLGRDSAAGRHGDQAVMARHRREDGLQEGEFHEARDRNHLVGLRPGGGVPSNKPSEDDTRPNALLYLGLEG